MSFAELDVVRVTRLFAPIRPVEGTEAVLRQPRVGDIGAVVHVLGGNAVIVECVDGAGLTLWLAEFDAEELESIEDSNDLTPS